MSTRAPGHERLRKLLFLVPFVSRNPGIGVDALAQALGVGREELLQDLDLLTLVGRPPFQPDDYIDLRVENDRVWVELDQRLRAPPRLTAHEAAALFAAAELLRSAASDALASALHKLERVLPPTSQERARDMVRKIDAYLDAPSELAPLVRAIVERRELEFDYVSGGRGTSLRRQVRPLELFSHRGQWYLSGYDLARADVRLFRLDRLAGLEVTDRTFEPSPEAPGASPPPGRAAGRATLPSPVDIQGSVRVRFSRATAPLVQERFGDDAVLLADGGVEVKVAGDSEQWLTQWILSFGGEAEVLSPAWAREAVARAARASLDS